MSAVTDDIMPGGVDANMGGGGPLGPEAWQNRNINDLTELRFDPISGFPIYKALLCEVERDREETQTLAIDSGEAGRPGADQLRPNTARPAPPPIYLDHNATTALDPEVCAVMRAALEEGFGNASAIYREGRKARSVVEAARRKVAGLLGCTARRICFTAGGSEANNMVLKGVAFARWPEKPHLITSCIEHPSVLETMKWLAAHGCAVSYLPVDGYGRVRPENLRAALTRQTRLVSIMMANNETGSLQPIAELAEIAYAGGALFHTDAVQAGGKIAIDAPALGVDFLTLSAHKLHGPKGIGALYIGKGIELEPLIHGGGQEFGLRAGTENSAGIVGFGKAAELAGQRLARLRDRLQDGLLAMWPAARVNGHPAGAAAQHPEHFPAGDPRGEPDFGPRPQGRLFIRGLGL